MGLRNNRDQSGQEAPTSRGRGTTEELAGAQARSQGGHQRRNQKEDLLLLCRPNTLLLPSSTAMLPLTPMANLLPLTSWPIRFSDTHGQSASPDTMATRFL